MTTPKETLLEWVSGEGQVRHRDGTSLGIRHYDIEVWQAGAGPPDRPAAGVVGGQGSTVKASIEFSDAERREFTQKRTALLLIVEDGRRFEFELRGDSGTIVPSHTGLARPRSRRGLGVTAAVLLAGLVYLLGQTAVGTAIASSLLRTPYGVPAALIGIALIVLMVGLQAAPRSRDPSAFQFGVIMFAIGLVLMWVLPIGALWIAKQMGWPDELGGILALFALLGGAGAFLGGGLSSISNAW